MRRREPWALFCGDAAFGRDALLQELESCRDLKERASLVQLLGQLGAFAAVAEQLERHPLLLEHADGRAALLRLRQEQQHPNPWLALQPEDQQPVFATFCRSVLANQAALEVRLGGGLGDQLEALALLTPLHKQGPLAGRVRLALPASSRPPLAPLLALASPQHPLPQLRWLGSDTEDAAPSCAWLGLLPMRALLAAHGLERPPAVLFGHLRQRSQRLLVVCWRSKVDPRERLWAHLRSLPFDAILGLYQWLLPQADAHGWQVHDITRYRDHEQQQLLAMPASSALQLTGHCLGNLATTAHVAAQAGLVVSVDTALIHLAHALDLPRWLLLHRHPDARWRQRLQQDGGTDQKSLRVLQQIHQDQWQPLLEQLRCELGPVLARRSA